MTVKESDLFLWAKSFCTHGGRALRCNCYTKEAVFIWKIVKRCSRAQIKKNGVLSLVVKAGYFLFGEELKPISDLPNH